MASAADLRAGFGQRRDIAMQRMAGMAYMRNQHNLEQQQKMEAEAARARAEMEAAEREQGSNWLNPAATGAMIGSSFAPGIGTAIGGGIGALAGLWGASKAQGGGMSGFGKALTHPMGNKFDGLSDIPVMQALGVGASMRPAPEPIGIPGGMTPSDLNAYYASQRGLALANQRAGSSLYNSYSQATNPLPSPYLVE